MRLMMIVAALLVCRIATGQDFPPLTRWTLDQDTRDWVTLLEHVNAAPVTGAVAVVDEVRISIPEAVQLVAGQYATVMQAYFGAGAHTNRSVSYDLAAGFFISRVPFSVEDARAVLLLTQAIPVLRQYSPDATCWGYPFGASEMVRQLSGLRPLYGPSPAETILGRPAMREDVLAALGAIQ